MKMRRNELGCSDEKLIEYVHQGYQICATALKFVEVGSFYGFVVTTDEDRKYFLKVYPKEQSLVPIHPSIASLNKTGMGLKRFRNEFGIKNLPQMIVDCTGNYCFVTHELILTLFDYIEGTHPSYSPNQLLADKMAVLLFQLHQIPTSEFSFFKQEDFDISFALGLRKWVDQDDIEIIDATYAQEMFLRLEQYRSQLLNGLAQLKAWQERWININIPFAITHGDPHHYNVLQTPLDVWLVDWDSIKIAPPERDLWHYQDAPLEKVYLQMNPQIIINKELCEFYRLQRFFEDICYYLEQVLLGKNITSSQIDEDKDSFLTHWGWSVCLVDLSIECRK